MNSARAPIHCENAVWCVRLRSMWMSRVWIASALPDRGALERYVSNTIAGTEPGKYNSG